MNFSVLIVLLAFITTALSFSPCTPRRASSSPRLHMAWGLQKLGQPVISVGSAVVSAPDAASLFGRKHIVTNGNDERVVNSGLSANDAKEQYYEELSSLDLNFRKQKLLMALSGEWSSAEKLERINKAATLEGILPSSLSVLSSSVGVGSMKAGGLTQEWDFDFGN
jgi:hypothetical protein